MKKILCLFLVIFAILSNSFCVFAANTTGNSTIENPEEEKQAVSKIVESSFFSDKLPKCEDISPDKIPKYLKENANSIGLPENGDFSYKKMTKDKLGIQHLRYTQMYNGIPVFGKEIIVDVKDEEIQSVQGMISTDTSLEKAVVNNTIDKDKVKEIAAAYLNITPTEMKQSSQANDSISTAASKCSDPELVWLDDNNTQTLTYSINVSSIKPKLINKTLFVDASSGKIIKELENIKTEAATGTGRGVLNDTKSVNLFQSNGRYYLKDVTLGDTTGITKTILQYDFNTLDSSGNVYLMYDTNTTLCETNYDFLSQRAAIDSHVYFNQVYRYYRGVFDRESYDDYGAKILTFIHYTPDGYPWANAAWTGNNSGIFVIGDGDGYPGYQNEVYEFSAALDVLGHEFTHAVIDNGGGELIYQDQSGAINESLADLFGQIIERKYKRDTDWTLGEDMSKGSSSTYKRSLSNPALYGQPDHMSKYVTTTQDNGGVHINSGITNKAAYLIASQIGDDKTAQIYYYAMTNKLTSSADFLSLRRAIISSAVTLYPGTNYGEVAASAFNQVGITDGITITSIKTDLASPQLTGTKIRWTCTVSGGKAPVYYYKIFKGSTLVKSSTAYTTANYFYWTPTAAGTDYRALVYVKENGAANETSVTKYSSYYIIAAPIAINSLTPDKASPQLTGTKIRWTCKITGGIKPIYSFKILKGSTVVTQSSAYSTNNYFDWTPMSAGTDYKAVVYVRETAPGSTPVSKTSSYYTVTAPAPIAISSLTPDKASPQLKGTKIRWTCKITGGVSPIYSFKILKGSNVVVPSTAYSSTNYFDWTPTAVGTDYRVVVYVREPVSGSTPVSKTSSYYTVSAPVPIAISSLTPDKASPQLTGTKIRWTCKITGGVSPIYSFKILKGSTVVVPSTAYSSTNYFDWTPTQVGTDYRAVVYVREPVSGSVPVSKASSYYTVSAPAPIAITSLTPDKASPQLTGTKIRWTCKITGGVSPIYSFKVLKGSTVVIPSTAYSSTNYFDWTPTAVGTDYRVVVYVREPVSGSTPVSKASSYYTVTAPAPIAITSLLPDKASPQPTGSKIRWTCNITGGVKPIYYFKIFKGSTLVTSSTAYSSTNYFDWTPTAAGTDYRAVVYVREPVSGSTPISNYSSYYTVTAPAPIAITSLLPDKASPQPTGSKIRWTCKITGGASPIYYFKIFKGSTLVTSSTAYSATNFFDWTPTAAGTDYRAVVYVREPASGSVPVSKYSSYYAVTAPAPKVIETPEPEVTDPGLGSININDITLVK